MSSKLKKIERHIRIQLNKFKFSLGITPIIEKSNDDYRKYIPAPFKAVCLISADFELAWAFRYSKRIKKSIAAATELGMLTRKNIPVILKQCEEYNIPITWATVGHLLLKSCEREDGRAHPEIIQLSSFENKFWKYDGDDWFLDDPCSNYEADPSWYCPDLIESIIKSPVAHEIGCHTFSHIDCRDEICSTDVFLSEIKACKKAALKFNIKYKSFVHPGNQIGNLNNLYNEGFTSYRTDSRDSLAFPKLHVSGLWELKNTCLMDLMNGWSIKYHINRYIEIIKRAIKYNRTCVLWFHPSFSSEIPEKVFPKVFRFLSDNKDTIWVTTHKSYVEWLNMNYKNNL